MIYLFLGLLFVLGLVVGSFIGNYTYRAPKGKSFFLGRSICDSCQVNLSWFDNIPVLSYLILRGRCRNCQRKISSRYPLIELATGLLFVGIFLALRPQAVTLAFYLLVVSGVVAVFVIDLEEKIIPDGLVFFLLTVTFLFLLIFSSTLFTHLATGFLAATFLLSIHLATRGKGMGLGDVKFALFGGAFLGWPGVVTWLFLAFLTGAVSGIILILLGKISFGEKIAFGPFLAISLIITLIWGEALAKWLVG